MYNKNKDLIFSLILKLYKKQRGTNKTKDIPLHLEGEKRFTAVLISKYALH